MGDQDAVDFETDMQTIRDYARAIVETQTKIASAYTGALANFETTVRSASATEAKADIVGAVLKSALKTVEKEAVTAVKEATDADLGPVVEMLHAVYDEVDRAAKAAESLAVGQWIKDLRTSVTDAFTQGESGDAIRERVEGEYKQNDAAGRGGYIGGVQIELEALRTVVIPKTKRVELNLYESWINENFDNDCMDGTGIISLQFTSEGEPDSATVKAPLNDKIAGALNDVMAGAGVSRLMDLAVVKKVSIGDISMCFESDNTVRKATDDEAGTTFLSSSDTWSKFRQFTT
jgi:ribosomal protein S20